MLEFQLQLNRPKDTRNSINPRQADKGTLISFQWIFGILHDSPLMADPGRQHHV